MVLECDYILLFVVTDSKSVCEVKGDFLQQGSKLGGSAGSSSQSHVQNQIESGDHSQLPSHLLLLLQSFDFEEPKAQNHVILVSMTLKLFKKVGDVLRLISSKERIRI